MRDLIDESVCERETRRQANIKTKHLSRTSPVLQECHAFNASLGRGFDAVSGPRRFTGTCAGATN